MSGLVTLLWESNYGVADLDRKAAKSVRCKIGVKSQICNFTEADWARGNFSDQKTCFLNANATALASFSFTELLMTNSIPVWLIHADGGFFPKLPSEVN